MNLNDYLDNNGKEIWQSLTRELHPHVLAVIDACKMDLNDVDNYRLVLLALTRGMRIGRGDFNK